MNFHDIAMLGSLLGLFVGGIVTLVPMFGLTRVNGLALLVISIAVLVNVRDEPKTTNGSKEAAKPAVKEVALDEGRPIFTNHDALVCPLSFMSDVRSSRSPEKLVQASYAIWGKAEKAKELGCDLLRDGVRLHNAVFMGGIIQFSLDDGDAPSLMTLKSQTHNASTQSEQGSELVAISTERGLDFMRNTAFPAAGSVAAVDLARPSFLVPGAVLCGLPASFRAIYSKMQAGQKVAFHLYGCTPLSGQEKVTLLAISSDQTAVQVSVVQAPEMPGLPGWLLTSSFRN